MPGVCDPGHLGVDYLVNQFDPVTRRRVAILNQWIVLFFAVVVFLYGGTRMVVDALTLQQTTPALGWRMGYVYLALPIAGVFMVIFTVENLLRAHRGPVGPNELVVSDRDEPVVTDLDEAV